MIEMDNPLIFEGKKYISARRASQKYGYSMDYIGQLARAGKIDSRLVGRTWYVADSSLSGYKNSRVPVEIPITLVKDVRPSLNLKPVWAVLVLMLILSSSLVSFNIQSSLPHDNTASFLSSLSSKIYEIWNRIASLFESLWSGVAEWNVKSDTNVAQKTETPSVTQTQSANTVNKKPQNGSGGLVVIPSTGVASQDNQIVNKIRNSFSDDVVVKPDESGVSGIIKPIFKNSLGEDYLYVLVPVNH